MCFDIFTSLIQIRLSYDQKLSSFIAGNSVTFKQQYFNCDTPHSFETSQKIYSLNKSTTFAESYACKKSHTLFLLRRTELNILQR
jgi:hypothetical protein